MSSSTVNLDALIPRSDLVSDQTPTVGQQRDTLSISDLEENGFFKNTLRKPDFQRETASWTTEKVVDIVRAFLDKDLIPAVILWNRGNDVFVIDGAHRLSALIAWIHDDYGDGRESNAYLGRGLTDDQRKVADRTRKEIMKKIGTYAEYKGLVGQSIEDELKSSRLSAMGTQSIAIQWVVDSRPEVAEASFFKINQAAQPIDPVERLILQTRVSSNAIAARCIARGGQGHKYWASYSPETQENIEKLGSEIFDILYKPPLKQPITTNDVPVAGKGYNELPFVFNLVRMTNGLKIPNTLRGKTIPPTLPPDPDGEETILYLNNVRKWLQLITTNKPGSLGLHPLIYFYAATGRFQENAFLASLQFSQRLKKENMLNEFTRIRSSFEKYIFKNKRFVSSTMNRYGGGSRSMDKIAELYYIIFSELKDGVKQPALTKKLINTKEFAHLSKNVLSEDERIRSTRMGSTPREAKSAAFIREAMENPVKCRICNSAIHANSMTFDHVKRKREGGSDDSDNLQPTHPYCNSGYKS